LTALTNSTQDGDRFETKSYRAKLLEYRDFKNANKWISGRMFSATTNLSHDRACGDPKIAVSL